MVDFVVEKLRKNVLNVAGTVTEEKAHG